MSATLPHNFQTNNKWIPSQQTYNCIDHLITFFIHLFNHRIDCYPFDYRISTYTYDIVFSRIVCHQLSEICCTYM